MKLISKKNPNPRIKKGKRKYFKMLTVAVFRSWKLSSFISYFLFYCIFQIFYNVHKTALIIFHKTIKGFYEKNVCSSLLHF